MIRIIIHNSYINIFKQFDSNWITNGAKLHRSKIITCLSFIGFYHVSTLLQSTSLDRTQFQNCHCTQYRMSLGEKDFIPFNSTLH